MRISDWSSDVYSSDLNVMIACTHTHSGPDTLNWYAFAPPIAGWWMEWLAQMVASTVYLALNNVDDCTAVRGQARFDLAVNRRRPVDGQIYRLPYEMGHTDQRLSILQFSAGDQNGRASCRDSVWQYV